MEGRNEKFLFYTVFFALSQSFIMLKKILNRNV